MLTTKISASGLLAISLLTSNILFLSACHRADSIDDADVSGGAAELTYGTKVSFGQGGGSERYRESGWSKTEEKFTWTEGTVAILKMKLPASNDSVTLKMRLAGLVKEPVLPFQPVEVEINGQKTADWQVSDVADFAVAIPRDLTKKGGELTITLKAPKATSPKALGINPDPRILGVCCMSFELSKG
ncbi:MAG: hypothetical protein QOD12_952 [Verrucomicrobiota bacterium]|jgi:hypothetical protein